VAGIGFNLEKILEGDTYIDSVKAHFYSTIIAAGPWLLSILTLFALSMFTPRNIDLYELSFFRTAIIYIYAFSLIIVGFLQLTVTRYAADKLYTRENESFVPAFAASAALVLVVQSAVVFAFLKLAGVGETAGWLIGMNYLVISMIWLVMIFLTALRDYGAISIAYATGSIIAVAGSLGLGSAYGVTGYFAGYLVGHLVIVVLLSARIYIEFPSTQPFDPGVYAYLGKHKTLLLVGFFYNLAIWIDKIVFWLSPHSVAIAPFLRSFPAYESASFFAYLTVVPALSIFLVRVETDFYRKYRRYYTTILARGSYADIVQARREMGESLRRSAGVVVKYQGLISLAAITFAPEIAALFNMPWMNLPIFRVVVLGAFLQTLLLIILTIGLYFDFQGLALAISAVFLATNGVFTFLTTKMEFPFFGFGYLASSFVSLVFAFYATDFTMRRLEYLTFASQPVGIHREEEIA
jgi:uncharacterized membrane protein